MSLQAEKLTDEQKTVWLTAATLAPLAQTASGLPWGVTGIVCLLALGITGLTGNVERETGWTRWLRRGACLWAGAHALELLENCWPDQSGIHWILTGLLLLSAWAGRKGRQQTAQCGILLWWGMAVLFGSVLLSAVPEIEYRELKAVGEPSLWRQGAVLLGILLLPGIAVPREHPEKTAKRGAAAAMAFSVCAQGVLSAEIAGEAPAPFYTLSRTVAFYGVFQNMEALAWLAMMLGAFLYLGMTVEGAIGREERESIIPGSLAVLGIGILYILGAGRAKLWLTAALIIIGSLIPVIERFFLPKIKMKKYENNG